MKEVILILSLCIGQISFSFENDLSAVCKRPGTNELFVGGEFEDVFVIDATTGETIRQLKVEGGLTDMQFSQDGSILIVISKSKAHFTNPETGERTRSISGSTFILPDNSPYFLDVAWYGHESARVYSYETGEIVYEHKNESKPAYAGLSADFSELFIVYKEEEYKKEKDLIDTPTEEADGYNVYNKAYVEQEADKKASRFITVDLTSKAVKLDVMIPYGYTGSFGSSFSKFGDDYYLVSWDVFVKINAAGRATPIEYSDATFSYATNHSQDGKYIMVLSTKDGFMYNCEKGTFYPVSLKENNEFSYSVDITDIGGSFVTLAKDYSVIEVSHDGALKKRHKINRSSENGFAVVYYNGYSKKEDRDKEAGIINAQLTTLGMDTIDLETDPGKSDFHLGIFATEEEAKKFTDACNKGGLNYITKIKPAE